MIRSRTGMRNVGRIAVAACCTAVLAVSQASLAYAASRTVSFEFQHLWITPEFETGDGDIRFTVKSCNRPKSEMTVTLRSADGINTDIGHRTIECREGNGVVFDGLRGGTFEFELGKLDDGKTFKGTATYSFPAPK
ncbi:hypothetical protein ACIOJE_12420 [Kitasatospora sp. NPDC087861]|uniref:hypothetical protein n=1 Tax=Kitasatospora sp. NPDC087861 TaxID=3364070 RepID=UPI00380D1701